MAELFKFRCSACAKPLGVSLRKVGRPVHCPRCGVEQIVPNPSETPLPEDSDEGEGDGEDAIDLGDLGIDLGGLSVNPLRPAEVASTPRVPPGPDVSELLKKFLEVGPTEPSVAAPGPHHDDEEEEADDEPIVATPTEPLVAASTRRGRQARAGGPRAGRDVVLPRTAVVAWSLFTILALALSFAAGLLVGHHHWK